jgi:hypothetical protein
MQPERLGEERRHLTARDRRVGTVDPGAAAARDPDADSASMYWKKM